jgi:hypothetical protein
MHLGAMKYYRDRGYVISGTPAGGRDPNAGSVASSGLRVRISPNEWNDSIVLYIWQVDLCRYLPVRNLGLTIIDSLIRIVPMSPPAGQGFDIQGRQVCAVRGEASHRAVANRVDVLTQRPQDIHGLPSRVKNAHVSKSYSGRRNAASSAA